MRGGTRLSCATSCREMAITISAHKGNSLFIHGMRQSYFNFAVGGGFVTVAGDIESIGIMGHFEILGDVSIK